MKRLVLALIAATALAGCSPSRHETTTAQAKVSGTSAPATVTSAFQKDHPNSMIKKVQKQTYPNGVVHYEFTFVDDNGHQQTVEYSAAGEQLPEH